MVVVDVDVTTDVIVSAVVAVTSDGIVSVAVASTEVIS